MHKDIQIQVEPGNPTDRYIIPLSLPANAITIGINISFIDYGAWIFSNIQNISNTSVTICLNNTYTKTLTDTISVNIGYIY